MPYHLEIIMPPTDDVESAVGEIMGPFDEKNECPRHSFWDFWHIGGRYSGEHLINRFDPERLAKFQKDLADEEITISGAQFGKPTLHPTDQQSKVDAMWAKHFPEVDGSMCPLFDSYQEEGDIDIIRFENRPEFLRAYRIIFAPWNYSHEKRKAQEMYSQEVWNGVSYQNTDWNGSGKNALEKYEEAISHGSSDFRARVEPQPDWLVVTVDYHS